MSVMRELQPGTSAAVKVAPTGQKFTNCFLSVETQAIRFRYDEDASDVTSSTGHAIAAGGSISFTNGDHIANLYVIAQSTTAKVTVTLGF